MNYMSGAVDWSKRAGYIWTRHRVESALRG
jgi:hypothetical protein